MHAVRRACRRNVGYMAELEEARLPHKLEELADCPAEDIVRALRRDHRYSRASWTPQPRALTPVEDKTTSTWHGAPTAVFKYFVMVH